MNRRLVMSVSCVGLAALLTPLVYRPTPRIVWNITASAPLGAYHVQPGRPAAVGDFVLIRPPAPLTDWLAERGYVPSGTPLLKRVAALPPTTVCRAGRQVTVNDAPVATALERDRFGRPLPAWSGCRQLAGGEVFLLSAETPDSLDGRYFGPLPAASIAGRATPIWTRKAR